MRQKLLQKNCFRKNMLFWQFLPLGDKIVDGKLNLRDLSRKSVNGAIKCAFRGAVALLVSELCVDLLNIVGI